MEKENNIFKVLPNFMIRTAMLPIESINEIKMEQDFFPSLKRFLDEGLMDEAMAACKASKGIYHCWRAYQPIHGIFQYP